ncbi:PduM family microcompartment protein [Secundilactobacillus kimchicus]|uniref:Propanediol utilization protein n=1 Tax=Secundilactobacillus kimchicus JCM 15530 TaxID=1302272 RepID=A0A0R1HKL6_9LACO|nr:PduM family microcompartment protein [Secundilactobacillus kimchicus]KRK47245.1 propanediol utilization protein [Secundilactobacillus kimchicus JCM 15530]MBT9672419.1 PduM family microcompartment protein [Secundilactobacillus kimchicus]
MDNLMARVVEKIQQRQTQFHQVVYSETLNAPEIQVFIDNANVDVMTTPLNFLRDLYQLNSDNDWVKWVMKGFEYDIQFRFEVSDEVSRFIPIKMIRDWPLLFVVDAKRPVYSLEEHVISRGRIAQLPDQSVVVLLRNQNLTSEAADLVRSKDIQLQVRNDAECIWQK